MKSTLKQPLVRQTALSLSIATVMVLAALPTSSPIAKVRNAEDLMVVDCLLPGQVRKLGTMSSFMTARRPIRTTQSDCAIRGGEYVAYDRANYQTALKVWLQQAETGDPEAQNYVGEIYAKGLGTDPDYAKAAAWYQKAVDQGYARAKINLGFLYEEGLGVAKDQQRALNLYREGTGITGDELIFSSTMAAALTAKDQEISGLSASLEEAKAANQKLKNQLESAKKEIESRKQSMQQQQSELTSARTQLADAQKRIAPTSPDLALVSQALAQAEERLTAERAQLEKERADFSSQRTNDQLALAKLRSQEADLGKRSNDPAAKAELDRVRATLTDLTLRLDQSAQRAAELEALLKANSEKMTQETLRYETDRRKMEQALAASKEDRELLLLLEQQLTEKQREVSRQRGTITALERQVQVGSQGLQGGGNVIAGGPVVEIIEPAITVTRGKPAAVSRQKDGSEIVGRVVSQSPVSEVSINGQMVKVAPNGMFRAQVSVPEQGAPIQVAATDRAGAKSSLEFTLVPFAGAGAASSASTTRRMPSGVKLGRQYAILIGNNEYGQYPALQSAVNDANQIGSLLKSRYGFQTTVLNNASRFDILAAFNDAREQLKPEDSLLVYFAGHGELDQASKQGYWVPVDGQANNSKTWLSNRAISDILNTLPARHVMVVADSCYSGAMTQGSLPTINPGAPDSAWSQWVSKVANSRSRTALTSGGLQPVADTGRGDNSFFASAVMGALQANSAVLEGQNLFRGVASSMALAAVESAIVQSPQYAPIQFAGHEAGEFLFVPKGGLADVTPVPASLPQMVAVR